MNEFQQIDIFACRERVSMGFRNRNSQTKQTWVKSFHHLLVFKIIFNNPKSITVTVNPHATQRKDDVVIKGLARVACVTQPARINASLRCFCLRLCLVPARGPRDDRLTLCLSPSLIESALFFRCPICPLA